MVVLHTRVTNVHNYNDVTVVTFQGTKVVEMRRYHASSRATRAICGRIQAIPERQGTSGAADGAKGTVCKRPGLRASERGSTCERPETRASDREIYACQVSDALRADHIKRLEDVRRMGRLLKVVSLIAACPTAFLVFRPPRAEPDPCFLSRCCRLLCVRARRPVPDTTVSIHIFYSM
jgi:hypothetical protein